MAEISRSRVTITLGRSGQVVKRAGVIDESSFADRQTSVGSKRSVMDRLGSNVDSSPQFNNKRQRGDANRLSLNASHDVDGDVTLTKDDLRFKIMHKHSLNKGHSKSQLNGGDLRDLLSRPAPSSTTSLGTQQQMSQLKDSRKHFLDPRDGRQQMQDPRSARQVMPEPRIGKERHSKTRDGRKHLTEPSYGRYITPEPKGIRNLGQGSSSSRFLGQISSSRSTDALPHLDSLRNPYSPWTLDSLRQGSSDRIAGASRGLSPPRRNEELERRPVDRAYYESRKHSYMSKDAFEHSPPAGSAPYLAKSAPIAGPTKSMAPPLAPLPPSVAFVQKSSYTVDDHQLTVDSFLRSLGLDKYSINFKAEEVDMYALKQMGDRDLKDLGIPMGPRKKIIESLLARTKRQILGKEISKCG